jgi:hypothetical protein
MFNVTVSSKLHNLLPVTKNTLTEQYVGGEFHECEANITISDWVSLW